MRTRNTKTAAAVAIATDCDDVGKGVVAIGTAFLFDVRFDVTGDMLEVLRWLALYVWQYFFKYSKIT